MCGIAGLFSFQRQDSKDSLENYAHTMIATLGHRGPNSSGDWIDAENGVSLAHSRLSILDTSAAGHQPMSSQDGRYIVSYNGEIYNHLELRNDLLSLGYKFKGTSDTETLVNCLSCWGIKETLIRLNGMFAIAIWDRQTKQLTLTRDRFGIKPLYWSIVGQRLIFGSELKALTACDFWTPQIDWRALGAYLRYTYVPAPFSIYSGVKKIEPGHLITFKDAKTQHTEIYWDATGIATRNSATPSTISLEEAVDELDALLSDAVQKQMLSDVPLGAFLSGGVDSSTIVALMQKQSSKPINTYSIGFDVRDFNEAEYAKGVANHLGTNHTELYVTPDDVLNVIPKLAAIYDEPLADSSQLPTYLISALTKKNVTVALSGDGGDEIFAGYNRYIWGLKINALRNALPASVRGLIVKIVTSIKPTTWDSVLSFLPRKIAPEMIGDKIHKAIPLLGARDQIAMYRSLVTHWEDSQLTPNEIYNAGWAKGSRAENLNLVDSMQLLDSLSYLPDCIMTKVDRSSMANSLEVRPPLLDHRIFEFSWSLPFEYKMKEGRSKVIMHELLKRYVPLELTERPKAGFSVPIGEWLRGPLREWSEDLLSRPYLREDLGMDTNWIAQHWKQHIDGTRNWGHQLWVILTLSNWYGAYHKPHVAQSDPSMRK